MAMRTRCCRRVTFSSLMLCATGSATAADSGFYLGLGEGWVKYPDTAIRQIGTTTLTGNGLHNTDFTWNFVAGYRIGRYLSIEAGSGARHAPARAARRLAAVLARRYSIFIQFC